MDSANGPIFDPSLRVLVVEDSTVMRDLLRVVLEVSGVRDVIAFDNAEEAFSHFCRRTVDLVITDWQLPAESGVELLRSIRRHPDSPNPAVPVILLTGHAEDERERAAVADGVTDFVAKPISARALRYRIAAALRDDRPFVKCDAYIGPDRRQEPRARPASRPVSRPVRRSARSLRPTPA